MENDFLEVDDSQRQPKSQTNLNQCSIRVLQIIQENGYKSAKKPFWYYDKENVDKTLNRKINAKKFKGFKFTKIQKKRE